MCASRQPCRSVLRCSRRTSGWELRMALSPRSGRTLLRTASRFTSVSRWDCERRIGGEEDAEVASLAAGAVELDAAAKGVDGAADDRESEAGAAGGPVAGAVDAVEALEDPLLVLERDTDAGVADAQHQLIGAATELKLNRTARRGVADRV